MKDCHLTHQTLLYNLKAMGFSKQLPKNLKTKHLESGGDCPTFYKTDPMSKVSFINGRNLRAALEVKKRSGRTRKLAGRHKGKAKSPE